MTIQDIENEEVSEVVELDETEYFGEKECRWFQLAARNSVFEHLKNGVKRILIVQPTGSGKTITIAMTLSSPEIKEILGITEQRPLRVLFVAHKQRLLTQAEQTFAAGSDVEIMTQSMFSDIAEEYIKKGWDIIVLDESHHEACSSFQYHLEKLGEWPLIGLTATPDRADGTLIKFEEIVSPISREQAVEEGYLAPTKLYSFVDAPEKDKTRILKDVLSMYAEHMGQTMLFTRTKKEARAVAEWLTEKGYNAIAIVEQSDKEVNKILEQFSAGKMQFIANCNKINEGVDVKGCETVVLGRQFGSYPQLNQVIGRAARPDSDCNVYELINPLSGRNLDTTVIVGTPESHKLIYRVNDEWIEEEFDYTTDKDALELKEFGHQGGMAAGRRLQRPAVRAA